MSGEPHLFAQLFPLPFQHLLVPGVDQQVGVREAFSWRGGCVFVYQPPELRLFARAVVTPSKRGSSMMKSNRVATLASEFELRNSVNTKARTYDI